jgi:hypothetical protein
MYLSTPVSPLEEALLSCIYLTNLLISWGLLHVSPQFNLPDPNVVHKTLFSNFYVHYGVRNRQTVTWTPEHVYHVSGICSLHSEFGLS